MNLLDLRALDAGDQVTWEDPDDGLSSGVYYISEIVTETGQVTDYDDMIVIRNAAGSSAEVYASELV